jgi:acetyl esterase/lipase
VGGILAVLASIVSATANSSFSPPVFQNANAVTSSFAYAPGERRTLDVYPPADARDAPVVVFFYGGSWQGGSKEIYSFLAHSLAGRGVMVVIPDYRVYPEIRFPGFLEDGAKAVAWTKTHAAQFGGNPSKIFLMGHSAGAHIAAMLAYDGQWLQRVGITSRKDIAGFIGIAGPYDFLPIWDPAVKEIFAVGDLSRTQPINFVTGGEPPTFIGVAASDSVVDPGNSRRLAARLRARGDDVTEKIYSGPTVGHLTIIGAFAMRFIAPVRDDVLDFIARVSARSRGRTQ